MKKEIRTVVYDELLRIEAYRFEGVVQPFPNHFHENYVIGFVEDGERCLSCRNEDYIIGQGSVILFNPGDNHACVQTDEGTLDYRGFNIGKEIILDLAKEVMGKRELPGFSKNVIYLGKLNRKQEITFIAAGFCGVCLYYLLENVALTYTMASNVGVIISVAPFITAILAYLFMKSEKKLQINFLIGFVVAMAGILFMIPTLFLFDFQIDVSRFIDTANLLNILYLGIGASAFCFVTWNYMEPL